MLGKQNHTCRGANIDWATIAGRISPGNAHPFILNSVSGDRGAKHYERVLAEHGFRYDSSMSLMQTADVANLFFVGEAKRQAYEKFNDSGCSTTDCPAKLVLTMKDATVFTDLEEEYETM